MMIPLAGSDIALALIAFAVILVPAIIIHELGHFLAAKLVGISVLEFGIGFPPRLGRLFMLGETEFTLNLLPIGGFVRPLGEDMIGPINEEKLKRDVELLRERRRNVDNYLTEREQLTLRGLDQARMKSVNDAPPLARMFFMAAGALANFLTAILLFFIAALIGLPIPVGGLSEVVAIPDDSLFAGTAVQPGDAIEMIDGERFSDFAAFYDALESYQGEAITFSLLRRADGEPYQVRVRPAFANRQSFVQVVGVEEESPASLAGILPGDLMTHVNAVRLPSSRDPAGIIKDITREYEGRQMALSVLRPDEEGGEPKRVDIRLIPRVNPPEGVGRLGLAIRAQFGLADGTRFANAGMKTELIPQSVPAAISHSLRTTGSTLALLASIPGQLLDGSLSGEDARPISIIGISKIGGEFIQRSLQEGPGLLLNFIALIGIFLGFTNLLPIPALDGGRMVFVLLEMLRGKPINPKLEARIHQIGILLLLTLGVIVMVYDLINPPTLP